MGRISAIVNRVTILEGWRAALLTVIAGAASALSQAPYHLFPVLFLTFPLFVILLDGAITTSNPNAGSRLLTMIWPAFKTGWLFGFGYFLAGLWWVGHAFLVDAGEFAWLLPVVVVALPGLLAVFWAAAAVFAKLAWHPGWIRVLSLACSLTFFEWVRGTVLTGFPWNAIGYALMPTPVMMQTANAVGVYGVSLLAIIIFSGPVLLLRSEHARLSKQIMVLTLPLLLLIAHVTYGFVVLAKAPVEFYPDVKLRVVQPAIDQTEKWDPKNEAEFMNRYLTLSDRDTGPGNNSAASFTHILWPESAFPFILTRRRDQLSKIANLLPENGYLITGAMREEAGSGTPDNPHIFNSLLTLNGNAEIVAAYDKTRLVPFGEFLPFQSQLEQLGLQQLTQLRGGFKPGQNRTVIKLDRTPAFLPLICYEVIFSGRLHDKASRPLWIVNLTNDAWFGDSAGPYQHAHQVQVRAVEEGLSVVRAANSGISMIVDPFGRILKQLPLGIQGVLDSRLPVANPPTYFSKLRNVPLIIFLIGIYLILFASTRLSHQKWK